MMSPLVLSLLKRLFQNFLLNICNRTFESVFVLAWFYHDNIDAVKCVCVIIVP